MNKYLFLIISLCLCLSNFSSCEDEASNDNEQSKQPVQSEDSVYSDGESTAEDSLEEQLSFESSVEVAENIPPIITNEDLNYYFAHKYVPSYDEEETVYINNGMGEMAEICIPIEYMQKWLDGKSKHKIKKISFNDEDEDKWISVYEHNLLEWMRSPCKDSTVYGLWIDGWDLRYKNLYVHTEVHCDIVSNGEYGEYILYPGSTDASVDINIHYEYADERPAFLTVKHLSKEHEYYFAENKSIVDYCNNYDNTLNGEPFNAEENLIKAYIYDATNNEFVEKEIVKKGKKYLFMHNERIISIALWNEDDLPYVLENITLIDVLEEYEKIR